MCEITEADYTDPRHRTAIIELLDEYTRDLQSESRGLSGRVKATLVAELETRKNVHSLLAFTEGEAAGLCISVESFSTFAAKPVLNIHDLLVAPPFRGQGLSKLLLRTAEEIARELGCCKLTLEVLEKNKIALNLYDSLGFNAYELDPRWGRALFLEKKLL